MVKSFPEFVLRGCVEHKTSEGFSSLILAAKPAKKAIWAPLTEPQNGANWEPPPSHHPSSGEQDRSRPLPLLRPLCSSFPCINRYQRACSTEAWPDPASPCWGGGRGCEEVATGLEGAGNVILGGHWTCVLPNPPKKIRSPFTHWYLEGSTQILLNFHVPKTEQNRRDTSPFVTFYKCTGIKKLATLGCIILPVF